MTNNSFVSANNPYVYYKWNVVVFFYFFLGPAGLSGLQSVGRRLQFEQWFSNKKFLSSNQKDSQFLGIVFSSLKYKAF